MSSGELVAAEPYEHILGSDAPTQGFRDQHEQLVARHVSERVVDRLKPSRSIITDGERALFLSNSGVGDALEQHSVPKTRQAVVVGLVSALTQPVTHHLPLRTTLNRSNTASVNKLSRPLDPPPGVPGNVTAASSAGSVALAAVRSTTVMAAVRPCPATDTSKNLTLAGSPASGAAGKLASCQNQTALVKKVLVEVLE